MVKETLEALAGIEAIGISYVAAKADGKIDLEDLGLVLPLAEKLRVGALGIGDVKGEIKNANGEELELIADALSRALLAIANAALA